MSSNDLVTLFIQHFAVVFKIVLTPLHLTHNNEIFRHDGSLNSMPKWKKNISNISYKVETAWIIIKRYQLMNSQKTCLGEKSGIAQEFRNQTFTIKLFFTKIVLLIIRLFDLQLAALLAFSPC